MYRYLLLILVLSAARADEVCLSADEDPYLLFGTKTSYIFANRGLSNTPRAHEVPGCEPIAFWMLSRHGSHNPESYEIQQLQKLKDLKDNVIVNYKHGNFRDTNHRICTSDINLLENVDMSSKLNLTFAGTLSSDGYMTTQQLAQAFKQKFPGLLTQKRHNYLFKFSTDERSKSGFRAFTEGLFGAQAEGFDIPKDNDETLVYPYKSCPVWQRDVEENNETINDVQIFKSKMEFKEMISNISLRLGFNYDIQESTVYDMYQMCRYMKAWNVDKISPWCAVFTREDLKRLEYVEDLETYYKYGYGSPLMNKIGCLPVKDMIDFFSKHISKEIPQHPLSMITFTDAPTLLSTLAALSTHRDAGPITGDNYKTITAQARKWTSSTMSPFNGNIAAVLYKCTPNGNFQVNDQHQVLFLENEKPMTLAGCRVGLCDWQVVNSRYSQLTGNCDRKFCNGATSLTLSLGLFVSLFVALFLF